MQNQLKTSPNKSTFLSRDLSTITSIGESRRCEHDARVADQKTIGIGGTMPLRAKCCPTRSSGSS